MFTKNYITRSCAISGGKVRLNGQQVFAEGDLPLQQLLVKLYQNLSLSYPKFYKMDNLCKLGWIAAEMLLKDAELKQYAPQQVGMVLANANASLDNDLKFQHADIDVRSPSVFVYTLPNIVIGEICIRHNFKGEHSFFVQHEFDAQFILNQASYLLDSDILKACICGWIDVLGEEYKAVLFLVEKRESDISIELSAKNMNMIFND